MRSVPRILAVVRCFSAHVRPVTSDTLFRTVCVRDAASEIRADLVRTRRNRIVALVLYFAVLTGMLLALAPSAAGALMAAAALVAAAGLLGVPLVGASVAQVTAAIAVVLLGAGLLVDAELGLPASTLAAGVACFAFSLAVDLGVFVVFSALTFRWWRRFGASALAAGAAATGAMLLVLHHHCPLHDAPHLYLAHLLPLAPVAMTAAFVRASFVA